MCLCSCACACTLGQRSGELSVWHTSYEEAYFLLAGCFDEVFKASLDCDGFIHCNRTIRHRGPPSWTHALTSIGSVLCVCLNWDFPSLVCYCDFLYPCVFNKRKKKKKKTLNLNSHSILYLQSDVIICNSYIALPHSLSIGSFSPPICVSSSSHSAMRQTNCGPKCWLSV